MLTLLLGTDWVANRQEVLLRIREDVKAQRDGIILMVPELISHDTERRLCQIVGDSASRYAEVLSFTRLCNRVSDYVGHGAMECLDNGGRLVAMASSARQMHSRLKAYASVETKPEFLAGLVDAVDEFKRCCISAEDLQQASEKAEGLLAQKLEELSLLMQTYDSHCSRGKRDPRDQMNWLLEQLEDSDFAENHTFYIDGFPDFTRQHMAILEHFIRCSSNVVVSLNCDCPGSTALAFEKAGQTAAQILQSAQQMGVQTQILMVEPRNQALTPVCKQLFQGAITPIRKPQEVLQLFRKDNVYEECVAVAQMILKQIQNGGRFRDVGVVCADMSVYSNCINMVFHRCGIPVYLSGTENILEKSVITTVLAAIEAALSGFEQRDVFRYAKSALSVLSLEESDRLENYAVLWSVNGRNWLQEWKHHPGGLGKEWKDKDRKQLDELNTIRSKLIQPLENLQRNFAAASNLRQQVIALYSFMEQIGLSKRLQHLANRLEEDGDRRNAQILNQLWEILINALEQLHDVLGETVWDGETFTRLLMLLLSQYDVGTIPTVLDCVTVGPVEFMRCQQTKHLYVLGAVEGSLPSYGGSSGVLTDQERDALRSLGVPLTGGAMDGLQTEFGEIYGVFCSAEQTLCVSCAAGEPSFVYRRLSLMAGGESDADAQLGAALTDPVEAGAYLVRMGASGAAECLGLQEQYRFITDKTQYTLGNMSEETVKKLYGQQLFLSASRIDKQAGCRLAHFLQYGMRAKERKPVTVDPAEFGTFVHDVLENTVRRVMELGGFSQCSLEQMLQIAFDFATTYAQERFSDLDSKRVAYLFNRNSQELEWIVRELWDELRQSDFVPVEFELGFGDGEKMPAVNVSGQKMQAVLSGFVDRVDAWNVGERCYFRIVDYKTGEKSFDYCDVFNGMGLQLLLYMFALEQGGQNVLGGMPVPAGVQYFAARVPVISADGLLTDDQVTAERTKKWKRSGLLLNSQMVLQAMEPGEKPQRMDYTVKSGVYSGDIADSAQFQLLHAYVFRLLGKMVDDIASGNVEANPYCRGSSKNVCAYCPYGAICHPETVPGRRNYKAMKSQRFWDEIGKEMRDNG